MADRTTTLGFQHRQHDRLCSSVPPDDEGSLLFLTVVLLFLVSILGISAINTSTGEVKIARNDYDYKNSFYKADAAVREAGHRVENETPQNLQDRNFPLTWLSQTGTVDLTDMENFEPSVNCETSDINPDGTTCVAAIEERIAVGASMDMMSESQVYEYTLYGYENSNRGRVLVQSGFKRRF